MIDWIIEFSARNKFSVFLVVLSGLSRGSLCNAHTFRWMRFRISATRR